MEFENESKKFSSKISKKLRVIFLKMQEGKTTVEIDGKNITIIIKDIGDGYYKSFYESNEEYDIVKQINIINENNFNFLTVNYRDTYSHSANGGDFHFEEEFFFPANKEYPNGYKLVYDFQSYKDGAYLMYIKDGIKYYIGLEDGYLPTITRTSNKKEIFVVKNNAMYKKLNNSKYTEYGVNIENENIKINETEYLYNEIVDSKEEFNLEIVEELKEIIKIYKVGKDTIMNFSHEEIVEKFMKLLINKFKIDFENQNIGIYPLEAINKPESVFNPNFEETKKLKKCNVKPKKRIFKFNKYKKIIHNLNSKSKTKKLTKKFRSNKN